MNAWARARSALALSIAAASLAGCVLRQAQDGRGGAVIPGSMLRPAEDLSAKRLLYISDWATNEVYVYDYDSRAQIAKLDGFKQPAGECVDRKNDVWITDFRAYDVVKYGHGGSKPIEILQTAGHPIGCAVDFTSGNLAVVNFFTKNGPGNLQVWKNGGGKPTTYTPAALYYLWPPAYNANGAVFFEGRLKDGSRYGVSELANGAKALREDRLKGATIHFGGAAEWDGAHIALVDQASASGDTTVIYRTSFSGAVGAVLGRTHLNDSCHGNATDVVQPFIVPADGIVVGGNLSCKNRVDYWEYPAGGSVKSTLRDAPGEPFGAAVSR